MRSTRLAAAVALLLMVWCGIARPAEDEHLALVNLKTVDNVRLSGLLRQPQGVRPKVGVVMVHGYSGNFYSSIMAFLPQDLTRRGFGTLAVNMRDHDQGPKKNLFEENRYDIAAAIDAMAAYGYGRLFLLGHSMGTNRVLYYLAATQDPRIAGLILSSGPGNLMEWNERLFGKQAAGQVLKQAQGLQAGGKGDDWMLVDLGPLGKALYTANHLVSLRGPDTLSDPFKNIARVTAPLLIVHGLADRLAAPEVADRLRQQAASGNDVQVALVEGADHSYRGCEDQLADIIAAWLRQHTRP